MTIEELEADGFEEVEQDSTTTGSLSDDGFEELSEDEIKAFEDEKKAEKTQQSKKQVSKIVNSLLGTDEEEEVEPVERTGQSPTF